MINNAIVPCEKPLPHAMISKSCHGRDSPSRTAALEVAAEFGEGSLKMSLFLSICTEPVGDGCWAKVVTGNVSHTIKIVRDHCTSPPRAPLQHRQSSSGFGMLTALGHGSPWPSSLYFYPAAGRYLRGAFLLISHLIMPAQPNWPCRKH